MGGGFVGVVLRDGGLGFLGCVLVLVGCVGGVVGWGVFLGGGAGTLKSGALTSERTGRKGGNCHLAYGEGTFQKRQKTATPRGSKNGHSES